MSKGLTSKNKKFIKALASGNNITKSTEMAGYSGSYGSQLLRKDKIIKAMEEYGISDKYIVKTIKRGIDSGLGIKASNSDAMRGVELLARIKGYTDTGNTGNTTNTQVNIYASMSTEELQDKLHTLQDEVKHL